MTRGYARILHATWKEALERASDLRVLWWAIQGLNLYKPTGVTPYGWRKIQLVRETRASSRGE
jgi:hypothetical protein